MIPILLTGFGIALGLLALLWIGQRRLIYFPYPSRIPEAGAVLPGAREVTFETEDGLTLGGWLVEAADTQPWGAVVVFNGNAGHREFRAPLAAELSARGLTVLLFDYRGFGGNPGRPSEAGLLLDGRAARNFLAAASDLEPSRVVLLGESLGTGLAVALAAELAPAALILRSPFTSLADVGRHHYPFLPVSLLLRDRYASIDSIADVEAPLLVIAGEEDRVVPIALSLALYQAGGEPKRFVAIPGADHNDYSLLAGPLLIDEIVAFLRSLTV